MIALVLILGTTSCALAAGAVASVQWWNRRARQRRSEELRRRFEDCYDQMVMALGRHEAEQDLTRSLERFDRELARLVG